jgi:hypothetical protein
VEAAPQGLFVKVTFRDTTAAVLIPPYREVSWRDVAADVLAEAKRGTPRTVGV